jgi:hydrogenase maturation protease
MSVAAAIENSLLGGQDRRPRRMRKNGCIVVGIGNPLMGDDGVGIEVAKAVKKLNLGRSVLVLERQIMDISVLDSAEGASKLVIVDAVKSGRPPGSVVKFRAGGPLSPVLRLPTSHEQNLHDILTLARKSGMHPPPTVVVGVEPADCTPGKGLSKDVTGALPRVLKEVRDEVKECARRGAASPTMTF